MRFPERPATTFKPRVSMLQRTVDWWRQAVVYQIYPRSFADSNGDGIGDLKGVKARIPYLRSLGVDAVWFSPFYPSALRDGGYDVIDYRDIDPRIGSLEDFDDMLDELDRENIKVIIDIVPNHTSDEHVWFQEAVKAGKGSAEREKYIFMEGLGPNKDQPPNDWLCHFGGSAWSPSGANDGQWYFHWFDESQPDLNWKHPEVQEDFIQTLRFWGDRGVSGFRIDVAHGCAKDMSEPFPNWQELVQMSHKKLKVGNADFVHPLIDRDEVHDIYRSWRRVFNEYDPPLMAVAESWVAPDRKHLYAADTGLGQAFSFDLLVCNFDADEYRRCIDQSLRGIGNSSTTWVLSNHDVIRHVTRFGMDKIDNDNHSVFTAATNKWLVEDFPGLDLKQGTRRARAALLMLLGLPGCTYMYQGEELGLPEVTDIPADKRQDPTFHRTKAAEIGRDGCRVPIPWAAQEKNFGFGNGAEGHIPQSSWMAQYAVDRQENDPQSMLSFYRQAIALRKDLQCAESIEWVDSAKGVLHFRRPNGWEIVINTLQTPSSLPTGKVVLSSSGAVLDKELPGEASVWIKN